jgi:hypothetical protein
MQSAATESAQQINRGDSPRRFWQFTTRQSPDGAPESKTGQRRDFIPYPMRRVVGTIASSPQADATVGALLEAGFERADIEVLHGEEGLHRLDLTGAQHGLLAQVHRTLVWSVGDFEATSLARHAEALRAGKFVIMVLAKGREKRKLAADILSAHGAEFIGYYGRWFWELLDTGPSRLRGAAPEPAPGQMYEVTLDGASMRLRFQSGASAIVTGAGRAAPSHATVIRLRPGLGMLTWKNPDGGTVVQVQDYESGRVYAVLTERDGALRRLAGTIRRLS